MQIGWIDFSKSDRDKVLGVIQLFAEQTAMDELGIGTVRDAFANIFFPGTSTIQTRAKYFFIVSYLLQEAGSGKVGMDVDKAMEWMHNKERVCCQKLVEDALSKGESLNGIIGHTALNSKAWIKRKPSDIYWNGVKTLGFFNSKFSLMQNLSQREYLARSLAMARTMDIKSFGRKRVDIEDDMDDTFSLGVGYNKFWNIPKVNPDWLNELCINLTADEAHFFRTAINSLYPNSVFCALLNSWDIGSKRLGFHEVMDKVIMQVDDNTRELLQLAKKFDIFVFSARACYNVIWSDSANIEAVEEWGKCSYHLSKIADIDLVHTMEMLKIHQPQTLRFLSKLQKAYKENADFEEVKKILIEREVEINGRSRAKLLKPSKTQTQWIGGKHLDYRSYNTCQLIIDIYNHV